MVSGLLGEWKVTMAPQGVFTQTPNAGLCEECSKVGLQVVFGWQAGNQDSVPSPRQPAVASASQPESHAPCRAMGELTQAVRGWRHHCTKSQQVSYTMRPWNPAKILAIHAFTQNYVCNFVHVWNTSLEESCTQTFRIILRMGHCSGKGQMERD